MKNISTVNELNNLPNNSIIKIGIFGCVPCEITEENLEEIEKEKLFNLEFYKTISNEIASQYNHFPIVILKIDNKNFTQDDTGILMDKDELKNWIENAQSLVSKIG